MIEKIKQHKKIIISFLVTLLFFGLFYKLEYSRCTFRMYINDYNVEFNHFLSLGRYILAFWWKLVSVLNFSISQTYFISFGMAIVFMTLSLYKMQNIVEKLILKKCEINLKSKILTNLLSIMIVFNPFVIELFLYLEKGCMAMSLFFSVLAAEKILNYFENKDIKKIIYAFAYVIISTMCYQGSTLIYLSLAFLFVAIYSHNFKKFIINNIIAVIPFVLGYAINFLCIKLFFTSERVASNVNIFLNIKIIIEKLPQMLIDNYGTLPKYFIIICLAIIATVVFVNIAKNKNKSKEIINLLMIVYLFFAILVVTIVPQLIMEANSIQLLARSSISFGAITGIFVVYILNKIDLNQFEDKAVFSLVTVFVIVQYVYMQITIVAHYKINQLDIQTAKQIQSCIEEYEEKNNVNIEKIVYYSDKEIENSYPNLKNYYQINQKIISIPGRGIEVLQYVSDRKYEEALEKKQEYEKYFITQNWDYFREEQLIFDGNILHLCVF